MEDDKQQEPTEVTRTEATHFSILIAYLAMRAGIKPETLGAVMPPSESEETKKAIEYWNAMLQSKKVSSKEDYATK